MKVKISDIKIGERFRKDLGNLQELADSIKGVGLLHPIVVNQDNELIAGARRLTACQQLLDWTEIDTTVVKLDNNNITRAELDENTIRQDFSFSERLAILQEIENQRSKLERNSNAKDKGKRSAEIAADLTNISPAQLYKEKKLFETLKSNPRLSYLVGELDRGDITVNRACNMIDEAKEGAESIRTLFGINGESMRKPGRHMVSAIDYGHYNVGWVWNDGTIFCLLCAIDEVWPDEYTSKDTIIPVMSTNEEWCEHFDNYHCKRPGNIMAHYIPHLGTPYYPEDHWIPKLRRQNERLRRKIFNTFKNRIKVGKQPGVS